MNRISRGLSLVFAVCGAGAALAAVQDAVPDSTLERVVIAERELDEVVITARKDSLKSLGMALIEAEDRFYERWNTLNDDDGMDILCRVEAPTGSRVDRRRCMPRLVDDLTRIEAMDLLGSTERNLKLETTYAIHEKAAAELTRRTLPLLNRDPELRQALVERIKLEQLLTELRARKFEGRRVVWD